VVYGLVGGEELCAPALGEVFEFWVAGADEVELLLAAPAFQLLLTGDGFVDGFVGLVIEQANAVILLRNPSYLPPWCWMTRAKISLVTPI
jgi:hypothetical protein